ncbi:hypothetical protein M569_13798 [Genlisea aurea]|uniref:DEK-C domain-containing protein n=1 Tax=Genlisea aurea TaxID=192259 RepID=S8DMU5_9LAMI|nr:hypothetical protein M569_13798 [Genlisea aurea]
MDSGTRTRIEETVLEILRNSNMDETTEFQIRKSASEVLGMDLSEPPVKMFVRDVVESYLREQRAKAKEEEKQEQEPEPEEEEEEESEKFKADREYDGGGNLIICRLSGKRLVTISDFKGKSYVSIREHYKKDDKELPSSKGISLNHEQWTVLKNNIPAIENAISRLDSR